jgi:hypothetical protein
MTLQLIPSEFPYIWRKFVFLFDQCISKQKHAAKLHNWLSLSGAPSVILLLSLHYWFADFLPYIGYNGHIFDCLASALVECTLLNLVIIGSPGSIVYLNACHSESYSREIDRLAECSPLPKKYCSWQASFHTSSLPLYKHCVKNTYFPVI